jgi:hypothetical protein
MPRLLVSQCPRAEDEFGDSYPSIIRDGQDPRRILRGRKGGIRGAQSRHAGNALPASDRGSCVWAEGQAGRAIAVGVSIGIPTAIAHGLEVGGRIGAGEGWRRRAKRQVHGGGGGGRGRGVLAMGIAIALAIAIGAGVGVRMGVGGFDALVGAEAGLGTPTKVGEERGRHGGGMEQQQVRRALFELQRGESWRELEGRRREQWL